MEQKIKRNSVKLVGRLTSNPEIKETNSGKKFAKISLANNQKNWNKEKTSIFNTITLWGEDVISKIQKYQKGSAVILEGRLNNIKKKTDDDKTITTNGIHVFDVKSPEKGYEDLNRVELVGRLISKPVLEEAKNNRKFAKVGVAVSNKKDKDDTTEADFYNFFVWGTLAESLCTLDKGTLVEMLCTVADGKYQKGEKTIYTTEIKPFFIKEKVWTENSSEIQSDNREDKQETPKPEQPKPEILDENPIDFEHNEDLGYNNIESFLNDNNDCPF